jgi:hypothetical protein
MRNSSFETETFDALRAGLSIDDVDFKDAGTLKLINRQNTYWQRVVDTLDDGVDHDRALCNQLRIRRRQVLSGQVSGSRRAGLPRFALGAATSVAAAIAIAVWWDSRPLESGEVYTRTASIESVDADIDRTEFADNIDFFTWLEKQSDAVADSGEN